MKQTNKVLPQYATPKIKEQLFKQSITHHPDVSSQSRDIINLPTYIILTLQGLNLFVSFV